VAATERIGGVFAATLLLPGLAAVSTVHAEEPPDQAEIALKYGYYRDWQPGLDRVKVQSPQLYLLTPFAGQWSLVDQFDADGRHFLVACRNAIGAGEPAALSQREDQATALAAQGYSNKRIASVLGLSTGSVSTLVYRASRKWGAGSRTRLIQEWQKRKSYASLAPDSPRA